MRAWFLGIGVFALGCGDDDGRGADSSTPTTSPTTSASTTMTPTSSGTEASTEGSDPTSGPSEPTSEGSTTETTTAPTTDASDTTPDGMACTYACTETADCLADGTDFGFVCQNSKCVVPCASDDACVAYFSGWTIESCAASSECELGTCVVFDGGSGCAFTPDLGSCADLGLMDVMRMTTEGTMATVCTEPAAVCTDLGAGEECLVPCADFVDCFMDGSGELCTSAGECVYACADVGACPASNFDNVVPACG